MEKTHKKLGTGFEENELHTGYCLRKKTERNLGGILAPKIGFQSNKNFVRDASHILY